MNHSNNFYEHHLQPTKHPSYTMFDVKSFQASAVSQKQLHVVCTQNSFRIATLVIKTYSIM